MVLSAINSFFCTADMWFLCLKNKQILGLHFKIHAYISKQMLFIVVPCVYCASFHRYQRVQERCSSTAQVGHGGQETELSVHAHLLQHHPPVFNLSFVMALPQCFNRCTLYCCMILMQSKIRAFFFFFNAPLWLNTGPTLPNDLHWVQFETTIW